MPSNRRGGRRGVSRRFRVAKREFIWITRFIVGQAIVKNGIADGIDLVEADDWSRDATNTESLEKGAVVTRIVGSVAFRTINGSGFPSTDGAAILWGIHKRDEDDTSLPTIPTTWFQEDWMHTQMEAIPQSSPTTPAYFPDQHRQHDVDIRVKRKLTSDETVNLWIAGFDSDGTTGADSIVATYHLRTLLQLP